MDEGRGDGQRGQPSGASSITRVGSPSNARETVQQTIEYGYKALGEARGHGLPALVQYRLNSNKTATGGASLLGLKDGG